MSYRSKHEAVRAARDASPLFTRARYIPGQIEIPMGTAHICAQCGNSFVCDRDGCNLSPRALCPTCGDATPHSAVLSPACGPATPHSAVLSPSDFSYYEAECDRRHGLYVVTWAVRGQIVALALDAVGELKAQSRPLPRPLLLAILPRALEVMRKEMVNNRNHEAQERELHAQRRLF